MTQSVKGRVLAEHCSLRREDVPGFAAGSHLGGALPAPLLGVTVLIPGHGGGPDQMESERSYAVVEAGQINQA